MPWFDLPLEQLREYRTKTAEPPEPPELDLWWQRRLDEARAQARLPELTRYEADIYGPVEVYDAEFSGAGGDRIRAWHLRPAGGQSPVVVKFIGYGGGRSLPTELRHFRDFLLGLDPVPPVPVRLENLGAGRGTTDRSR